MSDKESISTTNNSKNENLNSKQGNSKSTNRTGLQGGGVYVYFINNHRNLKITAAIVVALILASLVYIGVRNLSSSNEKSPESAISSEGEILKPMSDEELRGKVDQLIFNKKFKSAEELINFQEGSQRFELQTLLASVYLNQEKFSDALRIYRQMAEDSPDNWVIYKNIADAYVALENNTEANINYEKALRLLETEDSREAQIQKNRIETKIRRLDRQL